MGQEGQEFYPEDPQPGPSWQRAGWPLIGGAFEDDLTQALDPLAFKAAIKASADKGAPQQDEKALEKAASDSISAMMLIRTYRGRGHLAADLDPLGLARQDLPADLTPEFNGFGPLDQDRMVYVGGNLGLEWTSIRELVAVLRANYCGNIGFEYMHITDVEERRFLQSRIEGADKSVLFTPEGKKAILAAVIRGEQYEKFLGKKYVGTKRFGLDGGESMIPALEAVIKYGGQMGVKEIVYGMAHRGRLNILANVMAKPYKVIFHEFSGGSANPDDVGGSGDVKYHLGTSTDREFDGIKVHMSLVPNPSHLETVDPVVLGKVRATLTMRDDLTEKNEVLPVLIHGDAAFAGQGVVWETLGFQGIRGYATGGCVHFIINNQIGFTTSPQFARNSPYPSDVAKAVEPLMYAKIRQHPPVSEIYASRLAEQGVIDTSFTEVIINGFNAHLEKEFEAAASYRSNEADWFSGRWSGLNKPVDPESSRRNVPTGIEAKLFDSLGRTLTTVPEDLTIHKTLARVIDAKREMFASGQGFDWATGEALAFGSLASEGFGVRLSGQDSGRGTFSQRHAVWVDQTDEHKYIPLSTVPHGRVDVLDSPLSEYGVLGFEYGYAMADPKTLVLWEAQFGDFANGAQIIIDQYIAAAEAKWLRANGLVMLLPHGFEGQGPEHSSARLERFLQLCAQDNIQVCNITTPANYFHVLRRQMHRPFRKPLVIMTPKSLLRHPMAKSAASDFIGDGHFMRILSDPNSPDDEKVRRLVLCSGKVAYDLIEARNAAGMEDVEIVRLEQLYPFPGDPLALRLERMTALEKVVWCQEEPRNNGAWFFVEPLIEETLKAAGSKVERARYAGRQASASPATGLAKRHASEQGALVADALGLSVRSEIRRQKKG